jgi:hypothetical protein
MEESDSSRIWALGDYPRLARELLAELGTDLVTACRIGPGQRVPDVAAGTGVAAIPPARAGASACIGAMFAPDHQATADDMVRVCRPGGLIGLINWTPDGSIGESFRTFAEYGPPPGPGTKPPTLWGTEAHVRELVGSRVEFIRTAQRTLLVDHFADPEQFRAYYKEVFGPTIATYSRIASDADLVAALDREFLASAERANRAPAGEPARYEYEYLLFLARAGVEA